MLPRGLQIRKISVEPSSESAFFIDADRFVYTTGLNDTGQLGAKDNANHDHKGSYTSNTNIAR